ncbi:hypothetical protein [Pseudoalteromonas sp. MMG012]|uniref:hypothetical protein n=1 Tax=Pseudoalteromonas sp. MMG012 TaxID=2822686 RepID=UPI001B39CE0A|nr:hypothetical protein [Pseudoalteromonas sp. MMG012]MBQ4851955.1 hypothetical protein [Pseudoalteromonas sp. MMG012]
MYEQVKKARGNRASLVSKKTRSNSKSAETSVVQRGTGLTTLNDYIMYPTPEGKKDLWDPRRWRLNPLNILEGWRNAKEERTTGGYHASSKHGAHNTVLNSMGRVLNPSKMVNNYGGGDVRHANDQGRFNSEAWESYAWRKAKSLFETNAPMPVRWLNGRPNPPPANQSTWAVVMGFPNADVGITASANNGGIGNVASVSGVRVAVNYAADPAGANLIAWHGQMYPCAVPLGGAGAAILNAPALPQPGPPVGNNGQVVIIPAPVNWQEKLKYSLGLNY